MVTLWWCCWFNAWHIKKRKKKTWMRGLVTRRIAPLPFFFFSFFFLTYRSVQVWGSINSAGVYNTPATPPPADDAAAASSYSFFFFKKKKKEKKETFKSSHDLPSSSVCVCIFITKYCKARRLLDGFSCSPRREKEIKPVGKRRHQLTSYLGREREKKKKKKWEKRSFFDLPHDTAYRKKRFYKRV